MHQVRRATGKLRMKRRPETPKRKSRRMTMRTTTTPTMSFGSIISRMETLVEKTKSENLLEKNKAVMALHSLVYGLDASVCEEIYKSAPHIRVSVQETQPLFEKIVQGARPDGQESEECEFQPESLKPMTFSSIIGLSEAKEALRNVLIYPLMYPKLYAKVGKGILLYGPPGTGKTELARALIGEIRGKLSDSFEAKLFIPLPSQLKGKYLGESEKNIANLFRCASKAACEIKNGYSIIFIDEFDSVAGKRGDDDPLAKVTVNALLQAMDGVKSYSNVIVIAASNYPWQLDSAVLRRFDQQIQVGLPNPGDISKLIELFVRNHLNEVFFDDMDSGSRIRESCPAGRDDPPVRPGNGSNPLMKKIIAQNSSTPGGKLDIFEVLTKEELSILSTSLASKRYSSAEIGKVVKGVLRILAEECRGQTLFKLESTAGDKILFPEGMKPMIETALETVLKTEPLRARVPKPVAIDANNSPRTVFGTLHDSNRQLFTFTDDLSRKYFNQDTKALVRQIQELSRNHKYRRLGSQLYYHDDDPQPKAFLGRWFGREEPPLKLFIEVHVPSQLGSTAPSTTRQVGLLFWQPLGNNEYEMFVPGDIYVYDVDVSDFGQLEHTDRHHIFNLSFTADKFIRAMQEVRPASSEKELRLFSDYEDGKTSD